MLSLVRIYKLYSFHGCKFFVLVILTCQGPSMLIVSTRNIDQLILITLFVRFRTSLSQINSPDFFTTTVHSGTDIPKAPNNILLHIYLAL